MRKVIYLNCAEVYIFIVEVSALCQFGEVALGETKSESTTGHRLLEVHPLLLRTPQSAYDYNTEQSGGGRHRNRLGEWRAGRSRYKERQVCECVFSRLPFVIH